MSGLYKKSEKKIEKFFFYPTTSVNLGVSRFLYYGAIFFLYLGEDFSQWGKIPDVLWHPIFLFDLFSVPVLSSDVLGVLGKVWIVSILLSSIGLFTRLNTILAFLIGFYLLGLVNSVAKTHHTETLMLLIFGIMSFSRCGDGFSLDSLYKNQKKRERYSVDYSWPVILIRVMFTFMFCAAGLSKLRNSGFGWFTSDFLSSLFINRGFTDGGSNIYIEWLPFWFGSNKWLSHFFAGSAFFLEIFTPLALFNKYLKIIIIPSLFLMLLGFSIVLGIHFTQVMASFVFWLPWDRLIKSNKECRV